MQDKRDIIIIGAGLTGLTLGYLLRGNHSVRILEARDRIGGRIYTSRKKDGAPIEMGATWLNSQHSQLLGLLKELGIEVFEQKLGDRAWYEPFSGNPPQLVELPPVQESSYRIAGGTDTLTHTLAEQLKPDQIITGEIVRSIELKNDVFSVTTNTRLYTADKVITTLPPRLLSDSIEIHPSLPQVATRIMNQTHTWMGESIKVGFRFEDDFWRYTSGTIFSNEGPIPEMYVHSDRSNQHHALKGFFNNAYHHVTKEERMELAQKQLSRYFGDQCVPHSGYEELVWSQKPFTYSPYDSPVLPHQNNGHEVYRQSFLNGNFFVAGSETSPQFPGYMEGAVRSAYRLVFELSRA